MMQKANIKEEDFAENDVMIARQNILSSDWIDELIPGLKKKCLEVVNRKIRGQAHNVRRQLERLDFGMEREQVSLFYFQSDKLLNEI